MKKLASTQDPRGRRDIKKITWWMFYYRI